MKGIEELSANYAILSTQSNYRGKLKIIWRQIF
jgi:hypothetical protein